MSISIQNNNATRRDSFLKSVCHDKKGVAARLNRASNVQGINPPQTNLKNNLAIVSNQKKITGNLQNLPIDKFLDLLNQYLRDGGGTKIKNNHILKINKDINENTTIARYLTLNEEHNSVSLKWKTEPEGSDNLQQLLDAFKTRHGKKGSLYKMLLKFSFTDEVKSTVQESNIHDTSSQAVSNNRILTTLLHSSNVSVGTSSASTQEDYQLENDYPEKNNPFSDYSGNAVQTHSSNVSVGTSSASTQEDYQLENDYPEKNNPFSDYSGNAVQTAITANEKKQANDFDDVIINNDEEEIKSRSDTPNNIIDFTINENQGEKSIYIDNAIFLGLLNQYLITKNGRSIGNTNNEHVVKIKKDIKENTVIARYLILNEEHNSVSLKWKTEPENRDNLQQLLDAFKTRHGNKGSFYTMLSNFSFVERGYRLIKDSTNDKIINKVAEPKMHRVGKSEIVGMKREVMLNVLTHFSSPDRHEQPLGEDVLGPLISHYGRVGLEVVQAQKSAEKLASQNKLSLDDKSLLDVIKRFFHRIKTDERVERFEHEVKNTALNFQKVMKEELERVHEQHSPEQVAQRVKKSLNEHLEEAYEEYSRKMQGANIYPKFLRNDSSTFKNIDSIALENFLIILREIMSRHEKVFVDSIRKGISSFSADEYFQGKSREKAVGNVIKINNTLSSLYEVANEQHDKNMQILNDSNKERSDCFSDEFTAELTAEFMGMKKELVDDIKKKIIENYQVAFNMYNNDVNSVIITKKGFSAELKKIKDLYDISDKLVKDVEQIYKNTLPEYLNIDSATFHNEVEKMVKPVRDNIISSIPKVKSIGETLRSAFARAFKPTPTKILGSIPFVGGLAFSLTALPTAIAIPVGIAAAVVLPVALLGWVAFNIHKRFTQRTEIKDLSQQIEKRLQSGIV